MSEPAPSPDNWILQATEAMKNGNNDLAIRLARQALESGAASESAYLILAGASTDVEEAIRYLNLALEINPKSKRAREGLHWALRQQRTQKAAAAANPGDERTLDETAEISRGEATAPVQSQSTKPGSVSAAAHAGDSNAAMENIPTLGSAGLPDAEPQPAADEVETTAPREVDITGPVLTQPLTTRARGKATGAAHRKPATGGKVGLSGPILAVLPWLAALLVGLIGLGIWVASSGGYDRLGIASIFRAPSATPTASATSMEAAGSQTPTPEASVTPQPSATSTPTATVTITPTASVTPDGPTDIPVIEITPISALPPDYDQPVYEPPEMVYLPSNGQHWVDVNLTTQRAFAYDGDNLVREFIVSTGTWQYPTITGQYYVYIKYVADDMSGLGYYLPDVPYVQYFYEDYALHGTYWHSNFGTPMSHGCINFTTADAAWVFDWIGVGDLVNIHY